MPATVLLIDANAEDEQLFREELGLVCDQPFQLQVVHTLARALVRMRPGGVEPPPDVILLDLQLPDSLGLTTKGSAPAPTPETSGARKSSLSRSRISSRCRSCDRSASITCRASRSAVRW